MSAIFISYNRDDESTVSALAEDLRRLGHTVWFDQELIGGQTWWNQILAKVRECGHADVSPSIRLHAWGR